MPNEEQFVRLDPQQIRIGANVRTDLHADAKEFAKSIKERGVLEPVAVYRDDDGTYVALRGQRRTVVAAQVGTPTGDVPAYVVAKPEEADRIGDQMVENIHRVAMRDSEIQAGVEQLALMGVSAAQIAKRTALSRPTVKAALSVRDKEDTRARLEAGELSLDQAAIFAEFEHDPDAVARLQRCLQWGRSLEHVAQQLRDEAAEAAEYAAEVERLRGEGLPVLTAEEAEELGRPMTIESLRTADDEPVPEEEWPNVPSAAVVLVWDWDYPEDEDGGEDPDGDLSDDEDGGAVYAEPEKVLRPVWVVTDLEASGLRPVNRFRTTGGHDAGITQDAEAEAEAKRAERRRVVANNKAWRSAETVRRDWLRTFLTRKSAPKGAESLICEAVVTGHHTLSKAMDHCHPRLCDLLGLKHTDSGYGGSSPQINQLATQHSTPKAATMTTLAAVLAAWEDSTGTHTWRSPSPWDARVLAALMEWGYQPSDVERLLLPDADTETDGHAGPVQDADPEDDADQAEDGAA